MDALTTTQTLSKEQLCLPSGTRASGAYFIFVCAISAVPSSAAPYVDCDVYGSFGHGSTTCLLNHNLGDPLLSSSWDNFHTWLDLRVLFLPCISGAALGCHAFFPLASASAISALPLPSLASSLCFCASHQLLRVVQWPAGLLHIPILACPITPIKAVLQPLWFLHWWRSLVCPATSTTLNQNSRVRNKPNAPTNHTCGISALTQHTSQKLTCLSLTRCLRVLRRAQKKIDAELPECLCGWVAA